ncbi:MAG: polysaccharide deacetylase family protein, partial [Clostridia bacterium]|nr:polysaccharide deacetylase family protein [Clostridia bacterium]
DDLDGDISDLIVIESDYVEGKEGNFTFRYKISDKAGNEAETARKLTVIDNAAPVITINGAKAMYLTVGGAWSDPGATASDAFEGTVEVVQEGAPDTSKTGTYTVKYAASDSKGNSSSVERTVVVVEKPVPVEGGITGGGVVSESTVYLTFDDGPSYMTPRILDILAQYNVKATFFILNYSAANAALVARAINEGHTIGIHGYSHDYSIIYTSPEAGLENITKLHDKLVADFGYSTDITRFPGGSSNTVSRNYCAGVMSALCPLAEQTGYHYFDWNVSSQDAAGGYVSAYTIVSNVTSYLRQGRGNIVLMHDSYGKETTAEALPQIIEYCIENGYTLAGLSSNTPPVHHPISN